MFYTSNDPLISQCRTCMSAIWVNKKTNKINKQYIHEVPLASGLNTSIMELLQHVQPQIDVQIKDDLPKVICLNCVKKLQETYTFLEKYKYVDKKFRNMLQSAAANKDGENSQLMKMLSAEEISILAEGKLDNFDFNNLDDINLDYVNLAELDNEVELEIFNLEIDIGKVVNENAAKENYEEYENIDFYEKLDIDEITDEDLQNFKHFDTFYSDTSDNECEDNIISKSQTTTKISAKKRKNIIQLNKSPVADRNINRKEVPERHALSQHKDDSISCQDYENEKNSKISPEKSNENIKINECTAANCNTTKIFKQTVARQLKDIQLTQKTFQDGSILSQKKSNTSDITINTSTTLDHKSSQDENEILPTKKSPEKSKTNSEMLNTGPTFDRNTTKILEQNISKTCKEIQGSNMPTENEDDSTSCQKFEDDSASCQEFEIETPEKSKKDIEINRSPTLSYKTTKNSNQKAPRKRKNAEKNQMPSEKEDDKISGHESNIIPKKRKKVGETQLPPQNEDGSFSCRECETILGNAKLWQAHMSEHAKRKVTKIVKRSVKLHKCEKCNKEFYKKWSLTCHMRTHSDEAPFQCVECGKCFKYLRVLTTHMQMHKGEKTIQCPNCPKKFLHVSGLYLHKMVHTNEKPFVCDICGKTFHMAFLLRNHKLYHNNTRNYPCEHCDKRFFTADQQRRHLRTHTGEKPYRCTYCERAFSQSNDCIKHLRQHLGDNVYRCELCPLRFPLVRDLRKHYSSHNDEDEETRARNFEALIEDEKKLQIKLGVNKDVRADVQGKLFMHPLTYRWQR